MAWFWTDDLARMLIDTGIPERSLSDLLSRPAAIAAGDTESALQIARRLAQIDERETDAA